MRNNKTYKNSFDTPHPELTLAETLRAELDQDETVVWQGAPEPRVFAGATIVPLIMAPIFSAVPFVMAYQFANALQAAKSTMFAAEELFPLVMTVVFFCAFSFAGFVLWLAVASNMSAHKRVVYAITNKRVVIVRKPLKKIDVDSYYPRDIRSLLKTERTTGMKSVGDIAFYKDGLTHSPTSFPGLMNIRNPRDVERILKKMISENAK